MTLFLAAGAAEASILFQDNFNYPQGPIGIVSGSSPTTAGGGTWVSGAGSLYGTTPDVSASGANSVIFGGTSTGDLPRAYFTNGLAGLSMPNVPLFTNTVYYFPSNAPVAALYVSFSLTVPSSTLATNGIGNTYIAYLSTTNFTFVPRIYIVTNTATVGSYRIGANNSGSTSLSPATLTNIVAQDLAPDTAYTIVVRYALASGQATLWVNPTMETAGVSTNAGGATGLNVGGSVTLGGTPVTDVSGTNVPSNTSICGFGLRNAIGGGPISLSSLIVGTSFEDVVPGSAGSNPAFIAVPPAKTTNFVGDTATLSVIAGGDPDTMGFQWSVGGVPLTDGLNGDGSTTSGSQTSTLTISNVGTAEAGSYQVTVTNAANPGGASASAGLVAVSGTILPTFSAQPANVIVTLAGTANFSASATDGGPTVYYQWYDGSAPITGQTNATLSLTSATFAQGGAYSVTASNKFGVTQSTNATLTVNPPASVTIAYLRSTLTNGTFATTSGATNYTVTGTVTTWTNMTTTGNVEFYMQDGTAGITVFWDGAPGAPGSTNIPPPGTIATVTGPLEQFDGLLEIEPVYGSAFNSVTFVGKTNMPAPQRLPFDPNIINNPTNMQKHLVGSYFVASNVFLDLSTGPTFGNNANDPCTNLDLAAEPYNLALYNATNSTKGTNYTVAATNQNGQTFVIFYNDHTDIFGAVKPTCPVNVYGVLGIFVSSTPYTSGYEFTPSRLADIVPAVTFSNVLSNPVRLGDALTNAFAANTLQPGETITIYVTVTDLGGGTVNLQSSGDLAANWNITGSGGLSATATFTYTATTSDDGTSYAPALLSTFSSSGVTCTNDWSLYIPTADEQQVYLTEVFAAPTTNTISPAFNPLQRAADTNNVAVNDQYVEFANVSADTVFINHWNLVNGAGTVLHQFSGGEQLPPGSSAVIYGGLFSSDPSPPLLPFPTASLQVLEPANQGSTPSLSLSTGGGVIALYNASGNLIDRLVYPASNLANPSSFSRFPTVNSGLVPQAYISTNYVTPGAQYDAGSWANPTKVPTGVTGVQLTYGNPLTLSFPANTIQATTLWQGSSVVAPFQVVTGEVFSTSSGIFQVTNPPAPQQFFFITTQ
jgi:Lamin Tail Domain/Immunoglobulin domain